VPAVSVPVTGPAGHPGEPGSGGIDQRSDGGSFQRNRKRLLHPRFLDQL